MCAGLHMNKSLYSLSYTCVTTGTAGLFFVAIYLLVSNNYSLSYYHWLLYIRLNIYFIFKKLYKYKKYKPCLMIK